MPPKPGYSVAVRRLPMRVNLTKVDAPRLRRAYVAAKPNGMVQPK